jgi:2-amino-4-hydroxy-6-hydroxymethyldihydropteridine diphosphokinase
MQYINNAFLLTGGNIGDRQQNLQTAAQLIERQAGQVVAKSAFYETAAWGLENQPAFLNQALHISTAHNAHDLLHILLNIEQHLGRQRFAKYGPRTIDIDLLFFNNEIINTAELVIPHPQIENRRFVLAPLCELVSGYLHPVLHKTIGQLLQECPDVLPVSRLP